jgi:hypothetical protein
MIYLLAPSNQDEASLIVESALERSCGYGEVQRINFTRWLDLECQDEGLLSVIINPLELWADSITRNLIKPGNKTMILGALPPSLAKTLNAIILPINELIQAGVKCPSALPYSEANSTLKIEYINIDKLCESPFARRSCLRYDFADEWNNLGYGPVSADKSIWSLSQLVQLPKENLLATMKFESQTIGAYAGFWSNTPCANSLIWFNRSVGPVDSHEWRLVEKFLSDLDYPNSVCQPVISEIPYGYDAAITMRLDCDEDVESARPLWQAYQEMGVPFSLALHASVLSDERHHVLPRDVLAKGGALLSHTATHAPNWGGSYSDAYQEGRTSADIIEKSTGYRVRYAVSPFHQTPAYARAGLADANYEGCIGGIIRNDHDFLMARSGTPPGSNQGFIGHSQQCMLHGDCMLLGNDPLLIYKQAFSAAKASGTFFGYLDHPFSERYHYGWHSEAQRINMHREFVDYIKEQGDVLFSNQTDAMDFLYDRAAIIVNSNDKGFNIRLPSAIRNPLIHSIEYAGKRYPLPSQGLDL